MCFTKIEIDIEVLAQKKGANGNLRTLSTGVFFLGLDHHPTVFFFYFALDQFLAHPNYFYN